jgi:tripartite-type tricarboxylate transporter receptor subunit TctC
MDVNYSSRNEHEGADIDIAESKALTKLDASRACCPGAEQVRARGADRRQGRVPLFERRRAKRLDPAKRDRNNATGADAFPSNNGCALFWRAAAREWGVKQLFGIVLAAVAAIAAIGSVQAQDYPNRMITIVVPYAPGGPTDSLARKMATVFSAKLGQTVIVANMPGANSNVGTARVAKAAPDGYTLLLNNLAVATNPAFYADVAPDPSKALEAIGLINSNPLVLIGRKSLPIGSTAELVAWMKGHRARFAGSTGPLYAALFSQAVGAPIDFVPYKGGAQALQDVVGEFVDFFLAPPQVLLGQIRAGAVKALGITSKQRLDLLPDVPSLVQEVSPKLEILFWHCLFAPAGTPASVVGKLNAALQDLFADPAVTKEWAAAGFSAYPADQRSAAAASALVAAEVKRWGDLIRENKIAAPD